LKSTNQPTFAKETKYLPEPHDLPSISFVSSHLIVRENQEKDYKKNKFSVARRAETWNWT
jgi:hypothetical protein